MGEQLGELRIFPEAVDVKGAAVQQPGDERLREGELEVGD